MPSIWELPCPFKRGRPQGVRWKIRLYHTISRVPEGFRNHNRVGTRPVISRFEAANLEDAPGWVLDVLFCRHTQVTGPRIAAVSIAASGSDLSRTTHPVRS